MDIQKIEQLVALIEKSNINEIEIKEGETSIRITASNLQAINTATLVPQKIIHHTTSVAQQAVVPEDPSNHLAANENGTLPQGKQIKSPMVGTYYQSPSPKTAPFVTEGQTVKAGDALCIIEAMKIMNQIDADYSGTVLKILAQDGLPVEYNQPLFIIG